MSRPGTDLPHDLPDDLLREALVHPANLREQVRKVAPTLVDKLDFSRMQIQPRSYPLDDWRERELDVLVRVPYLASEGEREVLLCLLVEHQSTTDQAMPLRLILYAVLYWESQWRAWKANHRRGERLLLSPVLPIVLHTGAEPWDENRSLADLFVGEEELRALFPTWPTHFCDLPEMDARELVQSGEAWWQTLAVLRADREEAEPFLAILTETLQKLEPLADSDPVRWHQLLKIVLFWALFRRPDRERSRVLEAVRTSQNETLKQQEVDRMGKQLWQTYEQELVTKARAQGEALGEARNARAMLRELLPKRFGPLPPEVLERIDRAALPQLRAAVKAILDIRSLDELPLDPPADDSSPTTPPSETPR